MGTKERGAFLYEYYPYVEPKAVLTPEDVSNWYASRVEEIERRTGSVTNAIALVKVARFSNSIYYVTHEILG